MENLVHYSRSETSFADFIKNRMNLNGRLVHDPKNYLVSLKLEDPTGNKAVGFRWEINAEFLHFDNRKYIPLRRFKQNCQGDEIPEIGYFAERVGDFSGRLQKYLPNLTIEVEKKRREHYEIGFRNKNMPSMDQLSKNEPRQVSIEEGKRLFAQMKAAIK